MFSRLLLLFAILTQAPAISWSQQQEDSTHLQQEVKEGIEIREFKGHQLCEMQLSNGMRVILKQVAADEDELEIRLIAQGGWTSFIKQEKANARIATDVLWESGFGKLSPDQISSLMWRNSVELTNDIYPFSRTIEGSASEEGVETLFKMINWLFTEPQFTEEGYAQAKSYLTDTLKFQPYDANRMFDYLSKSLNTAYYKGFRQLSIQTLKAKTDLAGVKEAYEKSFGDPGEFIAIITGSFEQEEIVSLVKRYLATIPLQLKNRFLMTAKENGAPQFPSGVTRVEVPSLQLGPTETLTRITFPLKTKISETNFKKLFLLSKLIDRRLEKVFKSRDSRSNNQTYVSYDFPFYPYIDETWITIQLRGREGTPETSPALLEKTVVAALEKLQAEGPTADEVEYLKKFSSNPHEQLIENEQMLQLFIVNERETDWVLDTIVEAAAISEKIGQEELRKVIRDFIAIDNYTVIFSEKGSSHLSR
ncbi:insulinase family protein [Estrella lausannensis]|uniref:Peptidase n=1 Tax=Estrella lausannensis TaxID=483423 RepID=A0A0H5DR75_9BACT|nr:insulinase family protein [Estrella lausannensis]CRX38154.1 Peptidase [Estrella lausannensis]